MSDVSQFIKYTSLDRCSGAYLSPFLYFGHPDGADIDESGSDSYDPTDGRSLKQFKVGVASVSSTENILVLDTIDLYNGVSTKDNPLNNIEGIGLSGVVGRYDSDMRGPAKGVPLRFQRVHFLGYREGECCEPSEYYALMLVGDPVKTYSQISCEKSYPNPLTDKTEQVDGDVEQWNDLSFLENNDNPTNEAFKNRLIIGLNDPTKGIPEINWGSLAPTCTSSYQSDIDVVARVRSTGSCNYSPALVGMEDLSKAALHYIFNKLKSAATTNPDGEVRIVYDVTLDTNSNQFRIDYYRLSCAANNEGVPDILVGASSKIINTTTCGGG